MTSQTDTVTDETVRDRRRMKPYAKFNKSSTLTPIRRMKNFLRRITHMLFCAIYHKNNQLIV